MENELKTPGYGVGTKGARLEAALIAGFEAEVAGEAARLVAKRRKHDARKTDAVRQARMRPRRKAAENYWLHYLRTGHKVESWLVDREAKPISAAVIEVARKKMINKNPTLAKHRGLT